jgi:hypothetical protein
VDHQKTEHYALRVPATENDSLRENLISNLTRKLPVNFISRAEFFEADSSGDIFHVHLRVDGVRVAGVDLVYKKSQDGSLHPLAGGPVKFENSFLQKFPDFQQSDLMAALKTQAPLLNLHLNSASYNERVWAKARGFETQPAASYLVSGTDKRGNNFKEVWLLDVTTGQLLFRRSAVLR